MAVAIRHPPPDLVYAQSLSEMDRQLDEENFKKSQQVTELQKEVN